MPARSPQAPSRVDMPRQYGDGHWTSDIVARWPAKLWGCIRPQVEIGLNYDPWAHAAAWEIDVTLVEDLRMPSSGVNIFGLTHFGQGCRIELEASDTAIGQRSTLAHELLHVERGQFPRWAEELEHQIIDTCTMRRLVYIGRADELGALDALEAGEITLNEAADHLGVAEFYVQIALRYWKAPRG